MNEWSHLTDEELQVVIVRTMADTIRPIVEGPLQADVTEKLAETLARLTGLEDNVEVIAGAVDKSTGRAAFTHVAKSPMGEAYLRRIARDEEFKALDGFIH